MTNSIFLIIVEFIAVTIDEVLPKRLKSNPCKYKNINSELSKVLFFSFKCAIASLDNISSVDIESFPTVILKLMIVVFLGIIGILNLVIASSVKYSDVFDI